MPEKKVQKALKIVGIVLLVFVVIFAAAVATLFLRARRRRANHRATVIPQLPVTTQPSGKSITTSSSSRGNQQQAARKKSLRERERMNLAFGVVEDDTESRIGIEPPAPMPTPYNSSAALPMPASSSTMANPYDILIKGVRDPFRDPARDVRRTDKAQLAQAEGRTKGDREVGSGKEAPLRPMRTNGMPRAARHDPTTPLQHPSPVKKRVPLPVRVAKMKYESTSSPIKPQRALPTTTKAALGAVRPPRTPLVSQQSSSGRQTVAEAARSGMKQSTSDRSLNAGYF